MKMKNRVYNVNDRVQVTLTGYGIELLYDHYTKYTPIKERKNVSWVPSGYDKDTRIYKTELWSLMHIFGEVLWMGNSRIPFLNNNIEMIVETE